MGRDPTVRRRACTAAPGSDKGQHASLDSRVTAQQTRARPRQPASAPERRVGPGIGPFAAQQHTRAHGTASPPASPLCVGPGRRAPVTEQTSCRLGGPRHAPAPACRSCWGVPPPFGRRSLSANAPRRSPVAPAHAPPASPASPAHMPTARPGPRSRRGPYGSVRFTDQGSAPRTPPASPTPRTSPPPTGDPCSAARGATTARAAPSRASARRTRRPPFRRHPGAVAAR